MLFSRTTAERCAKLQLLLSPFRLLLVLVLVGCESFAPPEHSQSLQEASEVTLAIADHVCPTGVTFARDSHASQSRTWGVRCGTLEFRYAEQGIERFLYSFDQLLDTSTEIDADGISESQRSSFELGKLQIRLTKGDALQEVQLGQFNRLLGQYYFTREGRDEVEFGGDKLFSASVAELLTLKDASLFDFASPSLRDVRLSWENRNLLFSLEELSSEAKGFSQLLRNVFSQALVQRVSFPKSLQEHRDVLETYSLKKLRMDISGEDWSFGGSFFLGLGKVAFVPQDSLAVIDLRFSEELKKLILGESLLSDSPLFDSNAEGVVLAANARCSAAWCKKLLINTSHEKDAFRRQLARDVLALRGLKLSTCPNERSENGVLEVRSAKNQVLTPLSESAIQLDGDCYLIPMTLHKRVIDGLRAL